MRGRVRKSTIIGVRGRWRAGGRKGPKSWFSSWRGGPLGDGLCICDCWFVVVFVFCICWSVCRLIVDLLYLCFLLLAERREGGERGEEGVERGEKRRRGEESREGRKVESSGSALGGRRPAMRETLRREKRRAIRSAFVVQSSRHAHASHHPVSSYMSSPSGSGLLHTPVTGIDLMVAASAFPSRKSSTGVRSSHRLTFMALRTR